jgi:hypothetical protein
MWTQKAVMDHVDPSSAGTIREILIFKLYVVLK